MDKMTGPIERITLNTATFHDAEIHPTLINYFYGNNGAGKSTIARVIADAASGGHATSLTWQPGKSAQDYEMLVYNQKFVDDNIASYHNLKGVFTIGERNIAIEAAVAEKSKLRAEQEKQNADNLSEKSKLETELAALILKFQEAAWERAKTIRDGFPDTQDGYKRKAQFIDRLLKTTPVEHDLAALRALYETAFDPNAATYPELGTFTSAGATLNPEELALLAKPITSSDDSAYAQLLSALKATDWVQQGHTRFAHEAGNRCPYCQQYLPKDFEQQLAACFDDHYRKEIQALKALYDQYTNLDSRLTQIYHANLANRVPFLDTELYEAKSELLSKALQNNILQISVKIKEPSSKVEIEDLAPLIDEINNILSELNSKIKAHNDVVKARVQNKQLCTQQVWEMTTYQLAENIQSFKDHRDALEAKITELTGLIKAGKQKSYTLENEVIALNKQVISTADTVNSINELLRHAGFQGFTLREKPGHPNVYEVIREDGQIAKGLSEGERNFIAFLYFYHLVRGSHDTDGVGKDKIVVIDDPVSSMDSSALFIVASLVRELVAVCYNNAEDRDNYREATGDYIKQIFILTHNVYFHREITYNQIRHFHCVSFFMINKIANNSTVKLCVRKSLTIPTQSENYNPVKNSYAALWTELQEVQSPAPMMNVIHRILEYYFLQLCGYDGFDIRKLVLDENRDKFVVKQPNGQEDLTKYQLANGMLSYMNMSNAGVSDGLHYIDDAADTSLHREVFELIFKALDQGQHYNMMIRESR